MKLKLRTVIISISMLNSGAASFALPVCDLVLKDLPAVTETLRTEISLASENDAKADRSMAFISRLVGSSRNTLQFLQGVQNIQTLNTHVVSFGSGGDVLTPIYEFPLASNYHLVDLASGWGDGPAQMIEEIKTRLASLGSDAKVTLVKSGFLAWNPTGNKPWRELVRKGGSQWKFYKKPAVWKVEWTSPTQGKQMKFVHLHIAHFLDIESSGWVVDQIPAAEELGAMILMGSSFPAAEVLQKFIGRLKTDGIFHVETHYRSSDGRVFAEKDDSLFEAILPHFEVEKHSNRISDLNSRVFSPESFLLKKKSK